MFLELETRKQVSYKISEVSWKNIGFSRERSCLFPFGTNSLWQTRPTFIKVPGTNLCSARVFVFYCIWIKYVFFLYFFSFFALFGFVSYSISGNYLGKIKIWLTNGLVSLKPQGLVKFVTTKICEALYGKIEMPIPLLSILKFRMYNCFASKENIFSGMGCVDRKFKSCNQLQYDCL